MNSASKASGPTPGQANTVSTTTDPPSRLPTCTPAIVSTGSEALRSTWREHDARSVRPFARAVTT